MIKRKSLAAATLDSDPVFHELLCKVSEKLEAGERVDPDAFADGYPEHIERLRKLLPTLQAMAELGHSAAEALPSEPKEGDRPEGLRGTLGDFRIVREVGRGGMGVVYEAEQLSLGRRVALKVLPFAAVLDPRQLQRFKNEAQAAALLHHQNIVPVYSVGCERSVHPYAMQFVEGSGRTDRPTPASDGKAKPDGRAKLPAAPRATARRWVNRRATRRLHFP